ncbi:MAG: hypothetical protein IKY94_05680 [Lachnospiraceae bacterium]|nr:hypothetical protein [Lachnospiraceae bacterium]
MKRYKYKINYKKLVGTIFSAISIAFLLWVGISWLDIVVDNTTTAQHASWNIFRLMLIKGGLL